MINKLYEYCKTWNLEVNMDKSQIMIMKQGPGRNTLEEKWGFNGKKIEVVNNYKYLGVTLTPSLNLDRHFRDKNDASKFKIYTLWKDFVKNKNVNFKAKIDLFNAVCRSTVCYNSEVFGYKCYDELNLVQRFFIKEILHFNQCVLSIFAKYEVSFSIQF